MLFRIFTLFFTFLLTTITLNGQAKKTTILEASKVVKNTITIQPNSSQARQLVIDTLVPPIFADDCSFDLFSFFNPFGWGFVGGMNEFGDLEKAQRFYYDQENFTVLDASIFIADAIVVGDGEVFINVYEVDAASNGPGVLVGTSDPLRASDLAIDLTSALPSTFTFSTPAVVSGSEFFVSVDFSQSYVAEDTLSLLMTDLECGIIGDSWELFAGGDGWADMSDTTFSWGIDNNFLMLATVESSGVSATKEIIAGNNRIRLQEAFPNPAQESLTIVYNLAKSTTVHLEIATVDGKMLQQIQKGKQLAGQHQEKIAITGLSPGVYFYGLVTDDGRLMNKFVVK